MNISGRASATMPGSRGGRSLMGPAEQSGRTVAKPFWQTLRQGRVPARLVLTMTSQLATMLGAGCDLCAALEALARQQTHPPLKAIQAELFESVQAGEAFSQALAKHPKVFGRLYVTLVRAGETAGLMRGMLATLQLMLRNQMRVASSVRGALMYPCILLLVATGAVTVMTTFVLPRFAAIFRTSNAVLPLPTVVMLAVSEFMGQHWMALLAGLVALIGLAIWGLSRPVVKPYTHAWVLKIPLLGKTLQISYVVRSIQMLGTLVKSGLPLADVLVLAGEMMPNMYYRQFFEQVREHIGEGKPLSPDFEKTTLFPPMVGQMISVGEQTGTLGAVCIEVTSYLEEELQERIKMLTTAIEPIIIVGLGGVVGFIAMSVILPMFRIGSAMH